MKLYYKAGACSLSPHIALREAGIEFEMEAVDLQTKRTASGADFTQINGKGYIPALVLDNGKVLTEGAAIVQYIADLKPESGLAPANGSEARYELQSLLSYISSELHKPMGSMFNPAQSQDWKAAAQALPQPSFHLVADAGYANGEQAQALQQQGIEVHAPVKRSVNNQGDGTLFERSQFIYDASRDTYVCPAGALLERKQVHKADKVVIYAASDEDCGACALKPRCTQAKRRLVSRHLFEAALERIHAQATPEAMRLRRCTVEHPYAALKYQIFEKPRFLLRGLAGASTEISLATLVYNLKRAMNAMGPAMLLSQMRVA